MQEPPPGARSAPTPVRALVVDDEPVMRGVLVHFLRSRGYDVEHCADGESGLQRVREGGINLVVTDRNMPGMDGLALCRAIRALAGETYVYCIMLTASGEQQSLVEAMDAGVDDFLAKPLRLPELGARLNAAERVLSLEAGLAARNRELATAYGQLSRDLELARVLQVGHRPPPAQFGPVRFEWMFEAAGFIGGDTFDYFALGERHLCFYLCDVSGHGVAAAMIAFHAQHQLRASSQQLTQALARPGANLARIATGVVSEYNRRVLGMEESALYLTMVFGLMDLHTRQVALVHAGHPAALVADTPGAEFRAVGDAGVPVGILEQPGYTASTLELPPGARLVLHSDGITDCRDARDHAFGMQRMLDILRQQGRAPLADTGRKLHQALRTWRGGAFEDDLTLLAVEVR